MTYTSVSSEHKAQKSSPFDNTPSPNLSIVITHDNVQEKVGGWIKLEWALWKGVEISVIGHRVFKGRRGFVQDVAYYHKTLSSLEICIWLDYYDPNKPFSEVWVDYNDVIESR